MGSHIPVVILCGGQGTRLAEETEVRPKPMIEVGGKPILWHIMKHYAHYGFTEFVLALGYKGEQIKHYFLDFYSMYRDFTVSLNDGKVRTINDDSVEPWKVHLVDTGQATMTGGRIRRLQGVLGGRTFMLTYGDGVGNVDLHALLALHREQKGLVTLTAVRPPARFGALEFEGNRIRKFIEKSTLTEAWINGGFFVVEPEAVDFIEGDVMWERAPLERLAGEGWLYAYKHEAFWQCMDTLRDWRFLEALWESGNAPWKTWT